MDPHNSDINCDLALRKYISHTRPPKWQNQGPRDVFESPMINILPTDTRVPVRFSTRGVDVNAVKYVPSGSIDLADGIYRKMNISQEAKWGKSHGVVVFAPPPDKGGFEYKRGDRLWLYVDSDTPHNKDTAPVINLRTFETGSIDLQHVCWYPKYQSGEHEYWTLGGAERNHTSSQRQYWGIRQRTDGAESFTSIVWVPKVSKIPVDRARRLFRKRLDVVERLLKERSRHRDSTSWSVDTCLTLPTTNGGETDDEEDEGVADHLAEPIRPRRPTSQQPSPSVHPWKRRRLNLANPTRPVQSVDRGPIYDLDLRTSHLHLTSQKPDAGSGAIQSPRLTRARPTDTAAFDVTDPLIEDDPTIISETYGSEGSFISSAVADNDPIWESVFTSMKVSIGLQNLDMANSPPIWRCRDR